MTTEEYTALLDLFENAIRHPQKWKFNRVQREEDFKKLRQKLIEAFESRNQTVIGSSNVIQTNSSGVRATQTAIGSQNVKQTIKQENHD